MGAWFARAFPERQFYYRSQGRVRYVSLGPARQIAVAAIASGFLAWLGYGTLNIVFEDSVIAAKNARIAELAGDYAMLTRRLEHAHRKYSLATDELDHQYGRLRDMVSERTKLERKLNDMAAGLEGSRKRHSDALAEIDTLKPRIASLKEDLRRNAVERGMMEADAQRILKTLETVRGERDELAHQRSMLHERIARLNTELSGLDQEKAALVVRLNRAQAETIAVSESRDRVRREKDAMALRVTQLETNIETIKSAQRELVQRLHDQAHSGIEQIENTIKLTGIDVNDLASNADANADEEPSGGPYVDFIETPLGPTAGMIEDPTIQDEVSLLEFRLSRWNSLQSIMERLPLSRPTDAGYISSPFGKRIDPIRKKTAIHSGIDIAAAPKTPITATAPGTVQFAGRKGAYGNLVEIDHGYGIVTRYAHLNRILVKKGQTVAFREKIGLMGSTGRSTGSHIHYEVVYRGKPLDPAKFFEAGRYVFKQKREDGEEQG